MSTLPQITGRSQLVGLIGWPVEHSLSPNMHNAAFQSLNLNWAYVPLPVQPENVEDALKGLRALNFVGANVTVPHKQAVMRYMNELSDAARFTGAVNTILIKENRFHGFNTDAVGFLNALHSEGCHPKGLRVAVLGAGGAARAVVYALALSEVKSVTVFNRTAERAAFLVEDLSDAFPDSDLTFEVLTSSALSRLDGTVDLVVNTTSVGMYPAVDHCPWPDDVAIPRKAVFYDLVYNPLETVFLRRAREADNHVIDGLGMLVNQGAAAFKRWTGDKPPLDIMRQACLDGLSAGLNDEG